MLMGTRTRLASGPSSNVIIATILDFRGGSVLNNLLCNFNQECKSFTNYHDCIFMIGNIYTNRRDSDTLRLRSVFPMDLSALSRFDDWAKITSRTCVNF